MARDDSRTQADTGKKIAATDAERGVLLNTSQVSMDKVRRRRRRDQFGLVRVFKRLDERIDARRLGQPHLPPPPPLTHRPPPPPPPPPPAHEFVGRDELDERKVGLQRERRRHRRLARAAIALSAAAASVLTRTRSKQGHRLLVIGTT